MAIADRNPQHLRGHNRRQRLCQISDDIHLTLLLHRVQQIVHDLLDVRLKIVDSRGRECNRRESAQPGMRRCIHEQHLLHHQLGDRTQMLQPHGGQLLRRRSAVRGKRVQHLQHIRVAGHDPGVKKWIPMHRILLAQPLEKGIRIGENFRIE